MSQKSKQNELQIDYFSKAYHQFEQDFYRYSRLDTPLTFLMDDILLSMAQSKKPYFKLNKQNSKDNNDHYFIFKVEPVKENPYIKKFVYQKTIEKTCSID